MSDKQLYEEALADVRQIKEVAEANAQRAVLEAVTPRIRDLIEQEMLREAMDDDDADMMTDDISPAAPLDSVVAADAISPPDEEGKVTLDLDALVTDTAGTAVPPPMMGSPVPGPEYEISFESVKALTPVLNATRSESLKEFEFRLLKLGETITRFAKAGRMIKESTGYHTKIAQMISRVEDMYGYVQESVSDPVKKSSYESKLENCFTALNKLREQTMSKRNKKMMNEEDVTLKLTGLPDDIDLDSVGVDLITGEEGDEGEDGLGVDDGGGDEGGEDDMGLDDLDLGGDEDEGQEDMGESLRLSDDTIVEIDEKMLSREISRMRRLREEFAVPSNAGNGVSAKEMDDFGGGSDDGEPIEHDIPDQSPAKAALPLGEADEDLDELDQLGEMDELDELDQPQMMPTESAKRRLAFESRLQGRAKLRAATLKKEAARASARRDGKKYATLKREYAQVAKRFNESVDRSKKLRTMLAEATQVQKRGQNGSADRSAESRTEKTLRSKLAETNLINAKLLFTNKLLQNEQLSARQKAQVIEQLDSAKTVREAKLVYESLARTLAGTAKSVNESRDRRVLGSSSRVTRPASTQSLNEGYESERWARLAGITK